RKRLAKYFSRNSRKGKETRLGRLAAAILWQPAEHELIARLRERELIGRYRPRCNVQGHPTRMKLGFVILHDQQAPSFSLQAKIPARTSGLWGPVPLTRFMRRAVEELNHHFLLRDCPRETPMLFRNDPRETAQTASAPLGCLM